MTNNMWATVGNAAGSIAFIGSGVAILLWPDQVWEVVEALYRGWLLGIGMILGHITSEWIRSR